MDDFSNDDDDDALELGTKTWNRLMDGVNKAGYRDGIERGSLAVLQADFDKGYIDGFKMAFIIGKYKALATLYFNDIEHPTEINNILEKSKNGICHICKLESSKDFTGDSEIVINNHREHVARALHTLYSYFQPLSKDRGVDISNFKYE